MRIRWSRDGSWRIEDEAGHVLQVGLTAVRIEGPADCITGTGLSGDAQGWVAVAGVVTVIGTAAVIRSGERAHG